MAHGGVPVGVLVGANHCGGTRSSNSQGGVGGFLVEKKPGLLLFKAANLV